MSINNSADSLNCDCNPVANFLNNQEEFLFERIEDVTLDTIINFSSKVLWSGLTISVGMIGSLYGVISFIAESIFNIANALYGKDNLRLQEIFLLNIYKPLQIAIEKVLFRLGLFYSGNSQGDSINALSLLDTSESSTGMVDFQINCHGVKVPVQRAVPPLSMMDTIVVKNGKIATAHGEGVCFEDNDILDIFSPKKRTLIKGSFGKISTSPTFILEYADGKKIIQQQATRGCTAAVAQYLLSDLGVDFDIGELAMCNLGDDNFIRRTIDAQEGIKAVTSTVISLEDIKNCISERGSLYIGISDPCIMSHAIVVDSVENDRVVIREPYHGWRISVTCEAFMERVFPVLSSVDVIQAIKE